VFFHKHRPCFRCNTKTTLAWQTITQNGLTVHRVPIYICPDCGNETMELKSMAVYDLQVIAAYETGVDEITLFYGDIVIA
jgi:hypothetical protein